MDAETKGLVERARAATDDEFLSDYGVSSLIRDLAATITRLTAERDAERARAERAEADNAELRADVGQRERERDRLQAILTWNRVKERGGSDDAAYAAIAQECPTLANSARAALTQEATDGQS